MAKIAFSTGTQEVDPNNLAYPGLGLVDDPVLDALFNASFANTVGELVFRAKALSPQITESVWNNFVLSKALTLGIPFLRNSIEYSPNSLA